MLRKPIIHIAPNVQVMAGIVLVVVSSVWPFVAGLHPTRPVEYLGMAPSYMPGVWLAIPAMVMSAIIAFAGLMRDTDPSPRPWHWCPVFKRVAND